MRPQWNRLPLPCCSHGCCCCGLAEGQELDLLVIGHLWGDDYSQLPDPLGFFGYAIPAAVDAGGLRGYGLLEVLLLQWPLIAYREARTGGSISQVVQ